MFSNRHRPALFAAWIALTACSQPAPLVDGQELRIGSGNFTVQAPAGEGPVQLVDATTISFTVEPGDRWAGDERKGKLRERAEVTSKEKIAFGETTQASVDLRIEAQRGEGKGRWMTISQLHGPNRGTLGEDSPLASPVLAVQLRDDNLVIVARSGREGDERAQASRIATLPADFGNWHRYDMRVRMGEQGSVDIFRDGEQVVAWQGPVGYDAGDRQHYWKFGVYRSGGWTQRSKVDLRIACAGRVEGCNTDTQ